MARRRAEQLRRVVNATGVLLHTNLGRAPLGADAIRDAADVAGGYSNLEYRMDSGERGSRHDHAGSLLARACGADAGIVVNNNAAAVLLSLGALARDRSVIVSRGELVEIGGGFRVPEIMAESRCRLVEVGTTNRTRIADYERAIGPDTALLLKVHASNYRMVGFVESTPVDELARLGPPVMVDAGSGLLDETTPWLDHRPPWLRDEPGVRQAIDAGATLVTFSGDKLLGGPQAGIIVGTEGSGRDDRTPPARAAMRADKLTLALLQSVASAYLSGDATEIPLWRMATTPVDELRARAEVIAARDPGPRGRRHRSGRGRRVAAGVDDPVDRRRRHRRRSRRAPRPAARARRHRPRRRRRARVRPAHGRRPTTTPCWWRRSARHAGSRDGGSRRPREVVARARAHGHRSRSLRRREGARPHDRPRLRVHHAPVGHRGRLRRRAGTRAVPQEHARGCRCGRHGALRGVGARGMDAAERRTPGDPRAARRARTASSC